MGVVGWGMPEQYIEVRGGPVVKVAFGHAAMLRDAGVSEDDCVSVLQTVHRLPFDDATLISMIAFHFEFEESIEDLLS